MLNPSHIPTARVTSHELTWCEDSVSLALLASGMRCCVEWQTWTAWSLTSQFHISRQVNITEEDKLVYYKTTA